jgi:hypothetical protein
MTISSAKDAMSGFSHDATKVTDQGTLLFCSIIIAWQAVTVRDEHK